MELFEFEVAAADGVFTPAKATGAGKTISIVSPVKQPQRLRYAWKNNPLKANVFSLEGLPLSPFQLDLNQ
jgi:sialate O-acetylesterase